MNAVSMCECRVQYTGLFPMPLHRRAELTTCFRFDLIGAQSARVGEVSLFGGPIPQSYFNTNDASLCASSIPGRHGCSLGVCNKLRVVNRNPL